MNLPSSNVNARIEGIRPIPSITGLIVPIVGQFYRGNWASKLLQTADPKIRIFLKAEPANQYDRNAYKVLVWQNGGFHHVGYVQRHYASKIAAVMQGPNGFDNSKITIVARLKKHEANGQFLFEAEIIGSVTDTNALLKQDEAQKTNGGIFDTPKKQKYHNPVTVVVDTDIFDDIDNIKKWCENLSDIDNFSY